MPRKRCTRHFVWLLVCLFSIQIRADSSTENNSGIHDRPVVTPNFYDPNYHDDGRNHLRGPTAASSSSTISVMSPYAAASSATSDTYSRPGGPSSGTVMAIVDHFYGPNGEEQVKYTNPTNMDKDDFEAILASINNNNNNNNGPNGAAPGSRPSNKHTIQYSPPPPPSKHASAPSKYVGAPAPLSSLYKSSSSPYATAVPGYSLTSLYKSSSSENSYSKPPATYRPAFSTIYKDPPYPSPKIRNHYNKGAPEYSPIPSYTSSKDSILLHSSKEPNYLKGNPYYDSPQTGPKSISDAILSESYSKRYPSIKGTVSNVIDHDDSYPYAHAPTYPPIPPPPHMSMSHGYQPAHHEYSNGLAYSPGPLKAGLHSMPVQYSGREYGAPPPPPMHHDAYSSGFGGGYSVEESNDPYSRPSTKGYVKTTHPYSSSPPSPAGGHSLSSLYDPVAFDELYNNPKAKTVYSSPSMPKPGYGLPASYGLSYGPPVEYHMPPKGIAYSTSSSPYGSPGIALGSPKYKGPYRTVNTGPSGYPLQGYYGYGYGKPHGSYHDEQHKQANPDDISLAKDVYEDEVKYVRPRSQPQPPQVPQHLTSSPPSSLPSHLLQEYRQPEIQMTPPAVTTPLPPLGSHESHEESFNPSHHLSHTNHNHDSHAFVPSNPPDKRIPSFPQQHHHHRQRPYHQNSHEVRPNEIWHSPTRPSNNVAESSEEVHHVHVFEKGFFDKEKRLRNKHPRQGGKWTPVLRNYRPGSGEGGHGSASMERDARAEVQAENEGYRGRRHRPPPPHRRKNPNARYHNNAPDETNEERVRSRPPHSHRGRQQRS